MHGFPAGSGRSKNANSKSRTASCASARWNSCIRVREVEGIADFYAGAAPTISVISCHRKRDGLAAKIDVQRRRPAWLAVQLDVSDFRENLHESLRIEEPSQVARLDLLVEEMGSIGGGWG